MCLNQLKRKKVANGLKITSCRNYSDRRIIETAQMSIEHCFALKQWENFREKNEMPYEIYIVSNGCKSALPVSTTALKQLIDDDI
jgi:hypothetical protein